MALCAITFGAEVFKCRGQSGAVATPVRIPSHVVSMPRGLPTHRLQVGHKVAAERPIDGVLAGGASSSESFLAEVAKLRSCALAMPSQGVAGIESLMAG